MRVRPKTEYTIWVAKQAGLYVSNTLLILLYLIQS